MFHSSKNVIAKFLEIKDNVRKSARNEIDMFKHNIEHINADSISEFYSFIPQEKFVSKYNQLLDVIKEQIKKDSTGAANLIARLAKYNLNIKTELSVISKLDSPESAPNFSWANPRDAIMTNVYMLYPDFKQRGIFVTVDEYYKKFDLDFEALQVATYYLVENASKYCCGNSKVNVVFCEKDGSLMVDFKMYSLHIDEFEHDSIFDIGYKGEQAQKTGRSGKGIGLYRANRLITFCKGKLTLENGDMGKRESDGLYYSNNTFTIQLPLKVKG